MVLNGKSDPRDTTHLANRRADFQLCVQNIGRSVTFLGSPGEERHKVFVFSSSFIFTILHHAPLFIILINLNFYRQQLNNTRYLFGARLLLLQYYIVPLFLIFII